ncbi:MAG: hypothetical protein K0R60_1871 [Microbacterium sp.]|nr:hypothetical protein [Microbacterium sp.]
MTDAWSGAPATEWRSGAWSLELRDDEFADIAYRGHVVLRSVRAVVRDRNWDTAALVVDRVDGSDLALTLHVHSTGLGADLRGIVRAEVRGPGRLRVLTDLESLTEFATNRTGMVVLHPPQLAGTELAVRHSGGTPSPSPRISRRSTSPGCRGRMAVSTSTCASRARFSRWRTSATGRMPRTRRTAVRSRCPFPTRSRRANGWSSRSTCQSRERLRPSPSRR